LGPYGTSYGAEFCATQYNGTAGDYEVVENIKAWTGEDSRIRGLQISFTNKKITQIGFPPGLNDSESELDLSPMKTTVWAVWSNFTDHNLAGMVIQLSNRTSKALVAGNTEGMKPTHPGPSSLLAGLSGKYGANGVEQITCHFVKSSPMPANDTVHTWQ
jgi:hypothetical protein